MAQTVTTSALIDERSYPQLPTGVSRWKSSFDDVTGATTSVVTLNTDFNASQRQDFQRYVSVSHVGIYSIVAAPVIVGVSVFMSSGLWEDFPLIANAIVGNFDMKVNHVATTYSGYFNEPTYLGRTRAGSFGRLSIQLQEINTKIDMVIMTGLISEVPFLAPEFWRA